MNFKNSTEQNKPDTQEYTLYLYGSIFKKVQTGKMGP